MFYLIIGLEELGLSANENITPIGWFQILLAIASSSRLVSLHADYNSINDECGYLLVTIIAGSTTLETLDLEHTGLTDTSAKVRFFSRVKKLFGAYSY